MVLASANKRQKDDLKEVVWCLGLSRLSVCYLETLAKQVIFSSKRLLAHLAHVLQAECWSLHLAAFNGKTLGNFLLVYQFIKGFPNKQQFISHFGLEIHWPTEHFNSFSCSGFSASTQVLNFTLWDINPRAVEYCIKALLLSISSLTKSCLLSAITEVLTFLLMTAPPLHLPPSHCRLSSFPYVISYCSGKMGVIVLQRREKCCDRIQCSRPLPMGIFCICILLKFGVT